MYSGVEVGVMVVFLFEGRGLVIGWRVGRVVVFWCEEWGFGFVFRCGGLGLVVHYGKEGGTSEKNGCLSACWPTCLPDCLPSCQPPFIPDSLTAFLHACLHGCLTPCMTDSLTAFVHACLLA